MKRQDFYDGTSFDAYEFFGAHPAEKGFVFRTYAPSAQQVCLVGEFNNWQPQEMSQDNQSGIFSLTCPEAEYGQMYKYTILSQNGRLVYHCDPYGFGMQLRPNNASYIVDLSKEEFHDQEWMENRQRCFNQPLNIYELHLGSWRRHNEKNWFSYREIADSLIDYVKKHHYTHIEFLPLSEHPLDASWGYQITGYFSPTSRYGTAADLKYLINRCHLAGIGAIIDFVPVHFAVDDYGLNSYDGTELYEYPPSDVSDSEWGSRNFIYSRREVCSFLQSCAHFWLQEFHFDGLRMDAISRAIYWQGNPARGENHEALQFLRTMNDGLHQRHPSAMLIAEDSTTFPGVTAATAQQGLGFDYKWNLGWMNDTLSFFQTPPEQRKHQYSKLLFSMHYFYDEQFILPFSHDEVVHEKGTLLRKMWGNEENQWKQLRALYLYMYVHPGKKLNFMGNEFASTHEWNEDQELEWDLLQNQQHQSFDQYICALNDLYQNMEELHTNDFSPQHFTWVESNAPEKLVLAFKRTQGKQKILAVFNFSDQHYDSYPFVLQHPARLQQIFSSDEDSTAQNSQTKTQKVALALPPFSGQLFRIH